MVDIVERKKYISYLPDFLKQFFEFQEIGKSVDTTVNAFDKALEEVLNNAFITTCNEYGIRKYEALLKITPSADDTIESRRSRVLLRWNSHIPYTYRVLIRKLNTLCGVNNYTITDDQENYHLIFNTHLELFGQVKELEMMLERILPENIYYESNNLLECIATGSILIGTGIVDTAMVILSNDYITGIQSNGSNLIAATSSQVDTLILSNDYLEELQSDGITTLGTALTTSSNYIISNDFKNDLSTNGSALVSAGTVDVAFYEINN